MKRLFVLCGLAIILIACTSTSAVLFGRSRPPIDLVSAAGLNYCGTQVCFRGIALGTDWKNALEKLTPNADYFGRDALQVETTNFFYDMTLLDSDHPVVGQIEGGPTNGFALSLGNIVGHYGAPCLISYLTSQSRNVQIALIYPYFDVVTPQFDSDVLHFSDSPLFLWRIESKMPIYYVDFYLNDECTVLALEEHPIHTENIIIVPWRGFRLFYRDLRW